MPWAFIQGTSYTDRIRKKKSGGMRGSKKQAPKIPGCHEAEINNPCLLMHAF